MGHVGAVIRLGWCGRGCTPYSTLLWPGRQGEWRRRGKLGPRPCPGMYRSRCCR